MALDYVDLTSTKIITVKEKDPDTDKMVDVEKEVRVNVLEQFEYIQKEGESKKNPAKFTVKLNSLIMNEDINSEIEIEQIKVYALYTDINKPIILTKNNGAWSCTDIDNLLKSQGNRNLFMAIKFKAKDYMSPKFKIYDFDRWWTFEIKLEKKEITKGSDETLEIIGYKYTIKRDNRYGKSAEKPDFDVRKQYNPDSKYN